MKLLSLFAISDDQAMWRVRMQSDAEAFSLLVQRWQTPIQNLCTRMLGDLHRAEDLTQEAFARVFSHRAEYVPAGKFSTFLWRIALNLCYDELRRRHSHGEVALDEQMEQHILGLAGNSVAPDVAAGRKDAAEQVRSALLQLSEAYRAVLVLRHYEDLKFREIAEILGVPEGTVKSRMAEGLAQLGRLLEKQQNRPAAVSDGVNIRKELLSL